MTADRKKGQASTTKRGGRAGSRPSNGRVSHPTVVERAKLGKTVRAEVPRSTDATVEVEPGRDPVAYLEEQTPSRVQELVPIRYGRMLVSAFTFYRGAANIMAHDLSAGPRSGLNVQLCGDAHLSNFGGFAAPDRDLVFDVNDFDETHPGPFEWDVKRLAASFEIAGRERGFKHAKRRRAVLAVGREYRQAMRQFAKSNNLAVWYARLTAEDLEQRLRGVASKKGQKDFARATTKAQTKDSLKAFAKLTHVVNGEVRIISDPPLIVPISELVDEERDELDAMIQSLLRQYRGSLPDDRRLLLESYQYVDLARKVVGVGSVGTRCWILLLLGRDGQDPLFLQVKEAYDSVLEPALGRSKYRNHGQRVVEGQLLMQAASDIFLGWIRTKGGPDGVDRDYYVRQLWDWKTSVDVETITAPGLAGYAQTCAWALARAHARSGDRIAIASYLGKSDAFDRAIADFAAAYSDLNESDYKALAQAVRDGRVKAEEGI